MKVLHACEFYPPSVGGAQEVVRQVSTRLAAAGHEVTVATSADVRRQDDVIDGVNVVGFGVSGNSARGLRGDVDLYRRFVVEGDFDVVMTYAAQQWTTDALLPVLDEVDAALVLAPCGFSGLGSSAYSDYFAELPEHLRHFDALILHSSMYRDGQFLSSHGIDFVVVPNAADEREFGEALDGRAFRQRLGIDAEQPLVLTVGGHTGMKGHAEVMAMLRGSGVARDPGIVLLVNGNSPARIGCRCSCSIRAAVTNLAAPTSKVRLVDLPRRELVEAFFAADLLVLASKVECSPLVLFEAAAAGLPFLSVDVGNAKEIASWTGGGLVVERGPQGVFPTTAMVEAMDALLRDPAWRVRMGDEGRRSWRQEFTWAGIAGRYEAVYRAAMATRIARRKPVVALKTGISGC